MQESRNMNFVPDAMAMTFSKEYDGEKGNGDKMRTVFL
jgi:hypothetical protein